MNKRERVMDRSKWEYKKLGEVAKFINGDRGVNYPSQSDFVEVGIPFINAGHLKNNTIDFSSMNYITREKFGKLGSGKIQKGDLLFCLRGSLGKKAIVDNIEEGAIASSLVILRPSAINTHFLSYYLESPLINDEIERSNNGSSQPNLSAKSVSQFLIPIPKDEDQQRIVAELDCLNEMIALKQEQLKEFDKLAQSIFYDMFGDPSVMSEDNMNNVCETITDFVAAGSFASLRENVVYESLPSFAQLVRTVDLKSNFIKGNYVYVNESAFNFLWRVNLNKESIILPNVGVNCGEVYYIHPSMLPFKNNVLGPNAILVRSNTHNHIYLAYYFMSQDFQIQIKKITNAVGQPKFNKTELKKLRVLLPPLALQQQFAEKIQAIEAQKELVKKSIAETQQLLDSRMDFYFN